MRKYGLRARDDMMEVALAQPMTCTCTWCGQRWHGPAGEVIGSLAVHRSEQHAHEMILARRRRKRKVAA